MKSKTNRHHNWWERRAYEKTSILNRMRSHEGFIIPMNMYDHRELHRDLMPPPQPTRQEAEELLQYVGKYDSQSERIDYLDMAAAFFSDRNPRLSFHLREQRGYVLLHPQTNVEREIIEQEKDEQLWTPPRGLAAGLGGVAVASA